MKEGDEYIVMLLGEKENILFENAEQKAWNRIIYSVTLYQYGMKLCYTISFNVLNILTTNHWKEFSV